MKKIIFIIIIVVLACTTESNAFDGNRKGFVLSGGAGTTYFQSSEDIFYNKYNFTYGFIIGYGYDNKNLVVIDRSILLTRSNGNIYYMEQINGFGWYHYFSKQKKSKFIKIGYENIVEGIFLGGGQMFSNNIQIGITYSHKINISKRDRIRLFVSYVAF